MTKSVHHHKTPKSRKFAAFGIFDSEFDSCKLSMSDIKHPYILAQLFPKKPKPNARYYIKFSAWDKSTNKLRTVILWVPAKYKTDKEKRTFAREEITNINLALLAGKCFGGGQPEPPELLKFPLVSTLNALLDSKLKELRKSSQESYQTTFRKFEAYVKTESLERLNLNEFETKHAYGFRDYLLKTGIENRTANTNMIFTGSIFERAVERDYIPKNPFKGIKPLPEKESTYNVAFTPEHQTALETWMRENDPVLFTFTRFLYCAFIRPSELRFLKGTDIDLKRKTVTVPGEIAKNKKTQIVPINKTLLDSIGTAVNLPNKYLFGKELVWLNDTPCSENCAYERHKKALLACDLTGLNYTLYSWKHTGACRAIEAGVNPRKLQGLLRHSSLTETDTYLRSLGISLQNEELKEIW